MTSLTRLYVKKFRKFQKYNNADDKHVQNDSSAEHMDWWSQLASMLRGGGGKGGKGGKGEPYQFGGTCFFCGEAGHRKQHCPKLDKIMEAVGAKGGGKGGPKGGKNGGWGGLGMGGQGWPGQWPGQWGIGKGDGKGTGPKGWGPNGWWTGKGGGGGTGAGGKKGDWQGT